MWKTIATMTCVLTAGLLLTAAAPGFNPSSDNALTPVQVSRYGAPTWSLGGSGGGRIKPPHYLGIPLWAETAIPFATGGSMTQDGGLLFYTAYEAPHLSLARGIFAATARPDQATVDPVTGIPDLSQVFDEPIRILDQGDILLNDGSFAAHNKGFMAVIFDPEVQVDGQAPPWRVDCVTHAPDPSGACRRYDLQVVLNVGRRMDKDQGVDWNVPVVGGKPLCPEGGNCLNPIVAGGPLTYTPTGRGLENNTNQVCSDTTQTNSLPSTDTIYANVFQQRKLRLFLDAQGALIDGTTGQDPHPQWTDHGAARTFSFTHEGNPIPLQGIEPVLTADGRIMVWQSVSMVYDEDELGQQGGACWSYNHAKLGSVPRAACGVGRSHDRPSGVCVPNANHTGYPDGCDPGPQCLPGAPGPGGDTTCGNQVPYFHQQNVVYAFRQDPTDPHDWSQPRNLADLYTTHGAGAGFSEPLVDGVPFSERYGLGRFEIVHGNSSPVDAVRGQYYWMDPDGDWLLWNGIGHAATSIVGAATRGHMINLDGPVNPSDYNLRIDPGPCSGSGSQNGCTNVSRFNWTDRENFLAWGVSPGMWGPHLANPALPYRQTGERSVVMFGQQINSYNEIALHENADRILFLHMNKGLRFLPDWPRDFHNKARQITQSPHVSAPDCDPPGQAMGCGAWGPYTDDATGNGHSGTLVGVDAVVFDSDDYLNAAIIAECDAAINNGGYCNRSGDYGNREHDGFNGQRSGQSVRFYGPGGHVQVGGDTARLNPSGGVFDAGFTAGVFVRVINASSDARLLLEKDQSFKLTLESNGTVSAQLWLDDGTTPILSTSGPITAYQVPGGPNPTGIPFWNHVAVTVGFDGTDTHLRLYVDGQVFAAQTKSGLVKVSSSAVDLFIGKAAAGAAAPSDVAIDEVELWSVERTAHEVNAMAYTTPPPSLYRADASSQFPGLPTGLDPSFLKLPTGPQYDLTAGRVGLGRRIFHDPAFSRSSDMSCSTCHEATHFFAQHPSQGSGSGFSTSRGGTPLPVQTAFVLNRAFSTSQLWDARATSLEEQAVLPLFSPDEMAARSVPHVEWILSTTYGALFQAEYGTSSPTLADMQLALAAYERNLVAGDSAVDLYVAGAGSLNQAARNGLELFFGKARCSACHFGPSFTDEELHVTVADMSGNPNEGGAFDVTGRAADWRRFKTPSLRTGGQTNDFFHNGSAATLLDVVNQYDAAAVLHTGGPPGSFERDPEIRALGLTAAEKLDVVAFLQALQSPVTEIYP